jgi:hypothetical protein
LRRRTSARWKASSTAISRFIAETNDKPKPFVWTKSADAILAAVNRGRQALEAIH